MAPQIPAALSDASEQVFLILYPNFLNIPYEGFGLSSASLPQLESHIHNIFRKILAYPHVAGHESGTKRTE